MNDSKYSEAEKALKRRRRDAERAYTGIWQSTHSLAEMRKASGTLRWELPDQVSFDQPQVYKLRTAEDGPHSTATLTFTLDRRRGLIGMVAKGFDGSLLFEQDGLLPNEAWPTGVFMRFADLALKTSVLAPVEREEREQL